MLWLTTAAFCLAAFIAAFWSPLLAWTLVGLPAAWILLTLSHARRRIRASDVAELSPTANKLLKSHAHFYLHPFAGQEYGSTASMLTLAGAAVGVITAVRFDWKFVAAGVVFYVIMGSAARRFNPTRWLSEEDGRAHDEIVEYLRSSRTQRIPETDSPQSHNDHIVVTCSECEQRMRLPVTQQRIRATCPSCGQVQEV